MMRLSLAICVLCLLVPGSLRAQTLEQIRVTTATPALMQSFLHSQGYDVLPANPTVSHIDVIVSSAEKASLIGLGLEIADVAQGRPLAQALAAAAGGDGSIPSGYRDLAQIESDMQAAAAAYPSICQFVDLTATLGVPSTVEGRHIKAVKISDNVASHEDEKSFLIAATHHCREIINPVIALHAIGELTANYGTDPIITSLVNDHEIWIVPVWNPDGYEYVFNVDNLWRKNRRVFPTGIGVDLNRNYPFGWNSGCGSSTSVGSNIYKGPSSASEFETQTMIAFAEAMRFDKVADLHSYSREIRCSYGCWTHQFEAFQYSEAASFGVSASYPSASSCCLGGDIHFHMSTFGTHAFLWETGTSFQPTYASAVTEAQVVWPTLLAFLNRPIPIYGRVTDAANGLPVEGTVEVLGQPFQNGEVNRFGGSFGRYRYFMPAGSYTLQFTAPGYLPKQYSFSAGASSSEQHDIQLQPSVVQTGQPNHSLSTLELLGYVDISGATPLIGTNGPFSLALASAGGVLSITVSGPTQSAFVLLFSDLNVNNAVFGPTGSLDIGLLGATGNFGDISILLDGINPSTFFDQLATLGSLGFQTLQFTTAGLPPGIMGTMQALVTQASGAPRLTAAIEITIQ